MTSLQEILNYFNSKKSNKIFTRAEYFAAFKGKLVDRTYLDQIRCYLVRAGYLDNFEHGVYRKLKPIPKLNYTQLYKEAYPKRRYKTTLAAPDRYGRADA